MDFLTSCVLGLVQGLTEFIPVSSSGHLILVREWMGLSPGATDLAFDAVLQLATSLSILLYFRGDIWSLVQGFFAKLSGKEVAKDQKTLFLAIALGTVPAVALGVPFEGYMETIFRSGTLVAWMLIFGAVLMFLAEKVGKQTEELTVRKGFFIGLFQCLALIPGISRSGSTIVGGLFAGLNREKAAKFSFLLGLPLLFGSGLKKLIDLWMSGALAVEGFELALGSLVAFASGLAAIHFLILYLRTHTLTIFIWYRIVLALMLLLV